MDQMNEQPLRILVVMAHPDDESMGNGGMILRHAGAGIEVRLICATRGGAGWGGKPEGRRPEELPEIRTGELERAAAVLGIAGIALWDYPDGAVKDCDQEEIAARIAGAVLALRPRVVVGWGPDGGYGHPDHIAIGACTDRALASIADRYRPAAHYWMGLDRETEAGYRRTFDEVGADGRGLPLVGFDDLSAIFVLTDEELARTVVAINCHESQIEPWRERMERRPDLQRAVLGHDGYRRVGGPQENRRLREGLFPELEGFLAGPR
ncbi:MAG TPA: PIG-L family deacetylase [Candidatus Acidoferrales bacterium]|nr:PIG-L family deacetylase [Candidatus Acidoferrales bacterium]